MNYGIKFEFIGELATPKEALRVDKYPAGVSTKLNLFVKKDKVCSAFVEMSDFKGKETFPITLKFKPNKDVQEPIEIKIPYADRLKPDNIEIAPDYKKLVLDVESDFELKDELGKLRYKISQAKWNNEVNEEAEKLVVEYAQKNANRFEFLAMEDYIQAVNSKLDLMRDKKVRVLGEMKFEINKKTGDVYRKFIPSSIELASPDIANKLQLWGDYFFGEEALNEDKFEDTKMINIMGYFEGYDRTSKSSKLFPVPLVIDATKVDLKNEKHVARLDLFKNLMESEDGYSRIPVVINYHRGGQEVEFTENMLTEAQKSMIEAGLSTLDTYKPKGGVIGNNVEHFKLVNFDLSGDFASGALKAFDDEKLSDRLYVFNTNVTVNTKTNEVIEETATISVSDELDDLFS